MILLAGATGTLGSRVAAKLAERGAAFRALLREGTDAGPLEDVARGDLQDPATLPPALDGVDTVVTTVTSMTRRLGGDKRVSIPGVDARGNANLVDAAERAGVERFVFVSFPIDEAMLRAPLARAKRATEERLARSPMRSVVVAPDLFQEIWLSPAVQFDWQRGTVTIFGRGDAPNAYVAVDDVAEAVVRLALADDPPAKIEFGGPEALTRNEVVARVEQATGRPLKVRRIPRGVLRAGSAALGRVNPTQASLMAMAYAMDTQTDTTSAEPLRALGIEPRPVGEYIDRAARGA